MQHIVDTLDTKMGSLVPECKKSFHDRFHWLYTYTL